MKAYAHRAVTANTVKQELEKRINVLLKESWFKNMQKLEGFDVKSVQMKLSEHIERLKREDNLYSLGERYRIARNGLGTYNIGSMTISVFLVFIIFGVAKITQTLLGSTISVLIVTLLVSSLVRLKPIDYWSEKEQLSNAPAEYAKATTDLDRGMRSFINRSVREITQLKFDDPTYDNVTIGDSAKLSSRVHEAERIVTRYRSAIELHLLRPGGAAIGMTGERGTGKSELLRSFCETSLGKATLKTGGTIGVLVAVPAAFRGIEFLTLVAQELARAVPGYRTADEQRAQRRRTWLARTLLASGLLVIAAGFIFYGDLSSFKLEMSDADLFDALLGTGIIILAVSLAVRGPPHHIFLNLLGNVLGKNFGTPIVLQRARGQMGRDAEHLMLRLQYAETVTSQSEGSISWKNVGLKRSGQRSLSSLPLTEGSLISEIKTLTEKLENAGYRIIVAIDEMDKLDPGQATDEFLNSVKQLFSIRSCSFIVTISSGAWARFIQRGINLRDALDSSLDAVESIDTLDFLETRSLILHRDVEMTDSEILFCHVLSGGLPREAMRFARSLAMSNSDEEVESHSLSEVAGRVLDIEAKRLIDASRIEVSSWQFQDRHIMLRELDFLSLWWRSKLAQRTAGTVEFSWDDANKFLWVRDANLSRVSDDRREDAHNSIMRLVLTLQFLNIVRCLFCESETMHAAGSWQDHALEIGNKLTSIRRAIETDVFGADQALKEISKELDMPVGNRVTQESTSATVNHQVLLVGQEDVQGAKQAFQKVIDSGDPDHALSATVNLGALLAGEGDVQGAKQAFQKAVSSGHPDVASRAAFNLGVLLMGQEDVEGAKQAFQKAISSGHPDIAPLATVNLGVLLVCEKDMEGAKQAFQEAIDSGHPDAVPSAAVNLRILLTG